MIMSILNEFIMGWSYEPLPLWMLRNIVVEWLLQEAEKRNCEQNTDNS